MSTAPALEVMLQALLADYFKVEFHRETTECTGYALEIGTGTPKLRPAPDDEEIPPYRSAGNGREVLRGKSSVLALANALTDSVGMPVADRTQLAGIYNYTVSLNRVFVTPLPNVGEQRRGPEAFPPATGGVCGGNGPRVRPRGAQNQAGDVREIIGYDPPVAQ